MIPPAVEECLLPVKDCSWAEGDVPLDERGVRFSWLYDFVARIDSMIVHMWTRFRSTQRAAIYGPWDIRSSPMPQYPEELLTTRQLVSYFVIPLTRAIRAPLYARVPLEHRGHPSVFLSHTWDSQPVAGGHGSFDIALDHYRDSFVWMDIACYNQHRVTDESIAGDMDSIIGAIGQVAFILTTEPFFTRSWCLWEVVCGHNRGATVKSHDQITRIERKYWSSESSRTPPKFKSITELSATERADREKILELLVTTFGSVAKADAYVVKMLVDRSLNANSKNVEPKEIPSANSKADKHWWQHNKFGDSQCPKCGSYTASDDAMREGCWSCGYH